MNTRRDFLKVTGRAALGASVAPAYNGARPDKAGAAQAPTPGSAGSASLLRPHPDQVAPAAFDRLPIEWHRSRVNVLQQKLGEHGLDGIWITDRWNIIYFTGLFHTTTERPFSCFIPTKEVAVYWYHPGLDNALVKGWWATQREYYYDFPHASGGFPDQSKVAVGPPVDLVEWALKGIASHGFADKRIGLSEAPTERRAKRMAEILPKARFEPVDEICIGMRRVKTPEELALSQRAYRYFDQIHVFARDYILKHGTDLTDYKIAHAAAEYGTDLIMKDIKRDGHPHTAVGIDVGISARTGVGTAYPHPNQFHHNKVKRGDSLQVAGVVKIGGCGGEMYSPFQLAPWDAEREKVWEAMAEGAAMQVRLSKAGVRCQEVARQIHSYQVAQGMQKYLYQRIGHGEGTEGHQQPYIALGDETTLEENMTFSMEPGLFYPEGGYGFNPSNNVVVGKEHGWTQGTVPLTKEWCFLKL